ncbi:MAG: glutamate-5-semialdehyde dehydrogenase [bacterium]|nr:glutamate-5-semialdehyde dehydrogenase [bacterium]
MEKTELQKQIALAKKASNELLGITAKQRSQALMRLADLLEKETQSIIAANLKDIRASKQRGLSSSFSERLTLNPKQVISMARAVRAIARRRDIVFETLERRKRPNGLLIKKVRFPLGLIAIVYESRPNVTIDAFALAFKSGNAVLLKGGREIQHTNSMLVALIRKSLVAEGINSSAVQDVSRLDHTQTTLLMRDQDIDCLIPRGGKKLINLVVKNARVPVIITGASVVHTYVDASADPAVAVRVVLNAKTRRVSICNALDVLLIHRRIAVSMLAHLASELAAKQVEIRADEQSYKMLREQNYPHLKRAQKKDFDTEFLDYVLAIKIVSDFHEAMCHIAEHSLGHSEAIITKSKKQAEEFFRRVDAACLYWNTSTQFSDGGEFGLGGEIGISTQKLHARGPFAAKELTTYKYLIESNGAVRK